MIHINMWLDLVVTEGASEADGTACTLQLLLANCTIMFVEYDLGVISYCDEWSYKISMFFYVPMDDLSSLFQVLQCLLSSSFLAIS